MKLKVTSYNILHCEDFLKEKIDYDAFAEAIKNMNPDVIGMNEVHGEGNIEEYKEQAEILGKKLGYNYYFAKACVLDGGNPFGNAMLSRLPVKSCVTVPIPDPDPRGYDDYYETRCLLKMVTATDPEITFLITHFGLNPDEQENAVKVILENIPENRCVFMGDLNVRPDNAMLDPIRARLKDAAGGEVPLTFPSDKPDRKIDYIFVSDDIKVDSFWVEDLILSDHRPVSAEIEVE